MELPFLLVLLIVYSKPFLFSSKLTFAESPRNLDPAGGSSQSRHESDQKALDRVSKIIGCEPVVLYRDFDPQHMHAPQTGTRRWRWKSTHGGQTHNLLLHTFLFKGLEN